MSLKKDLKFLIDFTIPLIKYITPGIATSYFVFLETLPKKLIPIIKYNPIGHIIDTFNFMFVGAGSFNWTSILYSATFALLILIIGIVSFNQVEKNFMDTI